MGANKEDNIHRLCGHRQEIAYNYYVTSTVSEVKVVDEPVFFLETWDTIKTKTNEPEWGRTIGNKYRTV